MAKGTATFVLVLALISVFLLDSAYSHEQETIDYGHDKANAAQNSDSSGDLAKDKFGGVFGGKGNPAPGTTAGDNLMKKTFGERPLGLNGVAEVTGMNGGTEVTGMNGGTEVTGMNGGTEVTGRKGRD